MCDLLPRLADNISLLFVKKKSNDLDFKEFKVNRYIYISIGQMDKCQISSISREDWSILLFKINNNKIVK
jgi:hypothetical protein